jgi:transcriptional regulator with XRE-family HTH domain
MGTSPSSRLLRPQDIGRLIANGRHRTGQSQTAFAERLGVSRKTLSDIERGVADHVSLKTALQALALAGFVLEASARRPPTLSEIMAERAEYQARIDNLPLRSPPAPLKKKGS